MDAPRLKISPALQSHFAYRRFTGPHPRIFILSGGYWLDTASIHAARMLGWDIGWADVLIEGRHSRDDLNNLFMRLCEFRPDFVMSINMGGLDASGLLTGFLEDVNVPHVTWFVDDPRTILQSRTDLATSFSMALSWEKAYLPYLRERGYPIVAHMPLAAEIAAFNAPPAAHWKRELAFVGNSMNAPSQREWTYLDDFPVLKQKMQEVFDRGTVHRDRFADGLHALLSQELLVTTDEEQQRHIELLMFCEGTRRLRRTMVETLLPEGLIPYGDGGWTELIDTAGGAVNYLEKLPSFYRDTAINLNVTSIQMAGALNQRVFDCPAAGGFLITDAQDDLNLFFEEDEVVRYHTWEECVDKVQYFKNRPSERVQIAHKARAHILREHTYLHRLQAISDLVCREFQEV